jgi:hypothetical protein
MTEIKLVKKSPVSYRCEVWHENKIVDTTYSARPRYGYGKCVEYCKTNRLEVNKLTLPEDLRKAWRF